MPCLPSQDVGAMTPIPPRYQPVEVSTALATFFLLIWKQADEVSLREEETKLHLILKKFSSHQISGCPNRHRYWNVGDQEARHHRQKIHNFQ